MEKKITLNEIEGLFYYFVSNWEQHTQELKVNTRALYNIIGLKKAIIEKHNQTQEAIRAIAQKYGELKEGEQLPAEAMPEINELGRQEADLEYTEIILKEEDHLPASLVEILYDFIKFE